MSLRSSVRWCRNPAVAYQEDVVNGEGGFDLPRFANLFRMLSLSPNLQSDNDFARVVMFYSSTVFYRLVMRFEDSLRAVLARPHHKMSVAGKGES
jgi:hypothetical protein